ncbi:MAG: YlxR family protein [Bacilli bacterium]|nr:YlxR family protein [Bacilli bacterium]
MKEKKIPLRTCVVTKERLPKRELIRVVRDNENNVTIDLTGKANGRGAYLKRDIDVIRRAQKGKVLDKQLEVTIPNEIFLELENIIK